MEFTTQFELQSQATRLIESLMPRHSVSRQEREFHPLSCSFPRDLARNHGRQDFSRPQFDAQ
eukprot:CCRYP_005874-RB/>CCRYP_005874-RB protein AED:0.49 eAED:0.49 QI:0/-1/0/1/-1/0/1/0/61